MTKALAAELVTLLDSAIDADQIAVLRIERLKEPLSRDSELGKSLDGIENEVMRNAEKLKELNRRLGIYERTTSDSQLLQSPNG